MTEFINIETDEIYVLKEMFETVHRTQKYDILTRLDHIDLDACTVNNIKVIR